MRIGLRKLLLYLGVEQLSESKVRELLIPYVNTLTGKNCILVDGNTIYSPKKVIANFKKFYKSPSPNNLTDYMYEFFMNRCGTIAHYNKIGWVDVYATKDDIKELINGIYSRPEWDYDGNFIIAELKKVV